MPCDRVAEVARAVSLIFGVQDLFPLCVRRSYSMSPCSECVARKGFEKDEGQARVNEDRGAEGSRKE